MSQIVDYVLSSVTPKHKQGYTSEEVDEIISSNPEIDEDKFYSTLGVVTVTVINGETVYYAHDIRKTVECVLDNREPNIFEFD